MCQPHQREPRQAREVARQILTRTCPPPQSFVEEDVFIAKLHWLRHRANGLFRRRPDPDELRGRPRYRDWEA